jgi:hypothetical protein
MSFRVTAFVIGLFSFATGVLTYDPEIITSPFPVALGLVVMLMAVFNLIPELKQCVHCGRKILKKAMQCRYCGSKQP